MSPPLVYIFYFSIMQGGTSSKAKSSDGAGLDDNIPEKELNLISSNQDGRIILDLYYETLCPDSRWDIKGFPQKMTVGK